MRLLALATAIVHIVLSPAHVAPGGAVRLTATHSPCLAVDTISAISRAFPGNAFGGEGALTAHVQKGGAFTITGHVRKALAKGAYTVGFRCGGGNLGTTVTIRVT